MKYLSDNDVIFSTMSPKETMEFTGGHDKEKSKFMREVKAKQHVIEAAKAQQKPRQETALERIDRIRYQYNETDKRPKHLDNKNIKTFEDEHHVENLAPKKLTQQERRKKHYDQLWGLDSKKKGVQYVGSRRYLVDNPPKEKVMPTVDVDSISAGIDNYIKLTREPEIKRPEILNKKFYDDDVEKGLGSLLGIDKNFRK